VPGTGKTLYSRPIVLCATPKVRAISIKLSPASRRFNASCHWCGVNLGGHHMDEPFGELVGEGQGRKHTNASIPAATPQAALPRSLRNNHRPIMLPMIMLTRRLKIQIVLVLMSGFLEKASDWPPAKRDVWQGREPVGWPKTSLLHAGGSERPEPFVIPTLRMFLSILNFATPRV
jgi:hypothetical protein